MTSPPRCLVLNVVGLTPALLAFAPTLAALAATGSLSPLHSPFPAVTCSAQATFLSGQLPRDHGIVGNGWYFRDQSEVWLWRQSYRLLTSTRPRLWDEARQRDPSFTCANLFWWFNMYCGADWAVTPRPQYRADGRKVPDCYSFPASLRDDLTRRLGAFPLFHFWGPAADLSSSQWIIDASRIVWREQAPRLMLTYVPHLDYPLQKVGPDHPSIADEVAAVDRALAPLIADVQASGGEVIVLSEYGVVPVSRPVHLNRVLREHGWLAIREENGLEILDAGASAAFALADHQVAHVYLNNDLPAVVSVAEVKAALLAVPGVERVLTRAEQADWRIDHARAGDLVVIANADSWFTYYYWHDDARAPDFARTVDIHRKPGYDPVELFLNPQLRFPRLRIGWKLLQKALGQRVVMDLIPLDAALVRGSHGRPPADSVAGPLILSSAAHRLTGAPVYPEAVRGLILRAVLPS